MISAIRRFFLSGPGAGLLCVFFVAALTAMGWLRGIDRGVYDGLFRARGVRYPNPNILIVTVDDATVAREGQWPLSRQTYARLVDSLVRSGVRTVAFDFLFATPSESPEADAAFAAACRRAKRVVHGAAFYVPFIASPTQTITRRADRRPLPERFALKNVGSTLPASDRAANWVSSAEPALQQSSPAAGHVNIYPEWDGALRRIPHVIAYRGAIYPSLALAAATHWEHLSPNDVAVESRAFQFGDTRVPLDGNGESLINWVGGNRAFPTFSLQDVLSGRVPAEAFKDKLVFVGATAAGTFEHRPTPFSPSQPGVEMQANAADDILSTRSLHPVADRWRWACSVLFALLIGTLASTRRAFAGFAMSLGASLLLWQGAVWLLSRDIYFPVATPLLCGLLTYAASTSLNYRRSWEASWRADLSISLLARSSALMATGLDRAGAVAVVEHAACEALGARTARIVFDDASGVLGDVARTLGSDKHATSWPATSRSAPRLAPSKTVHGKPLPSPRARLDDVLALAFDALQLPAKTAHTLVAAPLPDLAREFDEMAQGRHARGVLLVAGRQGKTPDEPFGEREVALAEALARQAGLALENAAYDARLRSRVEAADRDLRDAYAVLESQSTRLAAAAEGVDDALIVIEEDGRASFVNAACARILHGAAPRLGDDVQAVLHANGLGEIAELWNSPPAEGTEDRVGCEVSHVWHQAGDENGDAIEVRSILAAQLVGLETSDGASGDAMLLISDVTAQRELDAMKSDFVAYVAHELRTPLTAMIGFASLLRSDKGHFKPEQRLDMAQSIMRRGERLNRMISELLEVSRLDAGKSLVLNLDYIDVRALCERIVEAQRVAVSNAYEYTMIIDAPSAVMAWVDSDRLDQIVTNLVSNAVKYSPDGGEVRVRIEEMPQSVQLSVSDTGMGMTTEQQSRLFTKYYRTRDALESGIKGTGLGLFLVRELVKAHGGTIEVTSEHGKGTTFTVALPNTEPETSADEFGRADLDRTAGSF
ncbi:MAG TPA: CHASE2 domain-containing protein [Abditibacteriaceae bacterium]|jgi:signal transduction histidine kinase/CHASE2 domain-containing sensor protein